MVNEVDIRSKSTLKLELFLFGHKLFVENNPKYHAFMYSLSQHLYSQQKFDIKWIKCLEKILNKTGFSNIWQTQTFKSIEWLKQSIKQTC